MFEAFQELAKYQPGFAAILLVLTLTIFKQAATGSKNIVNAITSAIIIGFLAYALLLQAKNQIKVSAKERILNLKIEHLENILKDNNLTLKSPSKQLQYDKQLIIYQEKENLL